MLKNPTAAFWNDRALKHGHTGWTDPVVYFFDQQVRLNSIESIIRRWSGPRRSALDYGCGVGDFTFLLSEYFDRVDGVDLSAEVLAKAEARRRVGTVRFLPLQDDALSHPRDFILSVTVMQHLTDDAALEALLTCFGRALGDGGKLVLLESATTTQPEGSTGSTYLRRRTVADYVDAASRADLSVLFISNFYVPGDSNFAAFDKYLSRFGTRLLSRMVRKGIPGAKQLLRRHATIAARATLGTIDEESQLKLMTFEKSKGQSGEHAALNGSDS
jgi:SAM-dependent methyltransferase